MINLPTRTKERLIILERLIIQQEEKNITSKKLSALTGWSEDTIRRDILHLHMKAGSKSGYSTAELKSAIDSALGIDSSRQKHNVCIVGLDKLGSALLDDSFFEDSPFALVAGFDTNVNRIEMMKSSFPLFATLDLEIKVPSMKIEYAVLTVSDDRAQQIADRLVSAGIKGIVNYTNVILHLPKNIRVRNVNPVLILKEMYAE